MGKKSKRKADRMRSAVEDRGRKRALALLQEVKTSLEAPPAKTVAEEIARRSGFELSPQPRWEIVKYDGRDAVLDNATGLYAFYNGDYESKHEDMRIDLSELENGAPIEALTWTHAPTGADVVIKTETQDERFWPIQHDALGWAMLDRYTTLVHPMSPGDPWDTAAELAAVFNEDAERWLADCAADAAEEGVAHWITPEQWAETPPDPKSDFDDQPADAPETPHAPGTPTNAPPLQVLVISSSTWPYGGVVGEVLQRYWNAQGNPPMTIMTSGSTFGAEGAARQLAAQVDGITHQRIEDKEIALFRFDMVFAFIRDYSVGASNAVAAAEIAGHPVHRIEERTPPVRSEWAER